MELTDDTILIFIADEQRHELEAPMRPTDLDRPVRSLKHLE